MSTLLIDNVAPRAGYIATAGQVDFTVPFVFFANSDLKVYLNGALQTLTTNYTCVGAGSNDDATRKITFTSGRTVGDRVVITRDVVIERLTDFPLSGPLEISELNTQLDRLFAIVQRVADNFSRTIRLADGDNTAINAVIPAATTRADKLIGFDANGDLTVTFSVTSINNVATQAAAAAGSAAAAAASASAAEAALDSFDDRYLGAKTADPTVDNDGNALITGAAYFNSTSGVYRIWNGAAWVNAAATVTGITASQITDSTATGRSVLTAATQAAARTALGATTVGANVFTAADQAAARSALGITTPVDWYAFANFR